MALTDRNNILDSTNDKTAISNNHVKVSGSNNNLGIINYYGITNDEFDRRADALAKKIYDQNEQNKSEIIKTVKEIMAAELLSVNAFTKEQISKKMREAFNDIENKVSSAMKALSNAVAQCSQNAEQIKNKLEEFGKNIDIEYTIHIVNCQREIRVGFGRF